MAANEGAALPRANLGNAPFGLAVTDFYLTNPIARASALMGELQAMAVARASTPMAAE